MELTLSVENIQIKNNLYDNGKFYFPVIFNTKKMKTRKMISKQQNTTRYLPQMMDHLKQPGPSLVMIVTRNRLKSSISNKSFYWSHFFVSSTTDTSGIKFLYDKIR